MRREGYLPAADLLRVLCIGLIGWYHFWQLSWLDPSFDLFGRHIDMQRMIRNGYMLVDILLVLSGFLLALPWAQYGQGRGTRPETAAFYKRRAVRILPSYLFAVLLVFFAWAVPGGHYADTRDALRDLFTHLTFTHNLFRATLYNAQIPGVLWTLAVEVQFYLLFPLLGRLYAKRPALVCGGMTVAALICRVLTVRGGDLNFLVNQLPLLLDVYAAGMLAAWLYMRLEHATLRRRWPFALLTGLCLCCIFQVMYLQVITGGELVRQMQLVWRLPMALLGALFLLFGSLAPRGLLRAVGNPLTRFLSGISYNFYIWHQFLARRLVDWHIPAYTSALPNQAYEQPWQSRYMLVCTIAALLAAVIATYAIEKPAARLLGGKRSRAVPPSVGKI